MSGSRVVTIVAFAVALGAAAVLEWLARRPASRVPTFGALCAYVLGYRVGRLPVGQLVVLCFWWWVGWHFFAR